MSKISGFILMLVATAGSLPAITAAGSGGTGEFKSIYGPDNRVDYYAMAPGFRKTADSVVSLWRARNLVYEPWSASYRFVTRQFGGIDNFCQDVRFAEQPAGASCSGALVGEDLVVTAGHCVVNMEECTNNVKIVFGFAVTAAGGTAPARVPAEEVYSCHNIVSLYINAEGGDVALIRLDRKVARHAPLPINRQQGLVGGGGVFMLGYPRGLPIKMADHAAVRKVSPSGYFVTDLDAFGGNSGSPVFSVKTGLIEGILSRGAGDFQKDPANCIRIAQVPQEEGRGEDVTSIFFVGRDIPPLAREKHSMSTVQTQVPDQH